MPNSAAHYRPLEIPRTATFHDGPGGLVRLEITTPLATAHIYLHGAHIAHYQPAGAAPVLFMSGSSLFAPGKAIRGGVPIIFPWFGGRAGHPESPAHGFARTAAWEVESLASADGQTVTVVLKLTSSETTRALWPHDFILRHRIAVGAQLGMTLEVENTSPIPVQFEEALHTYLTVADVRGVTVTGLESTDFIDKVDALKRKHEGTAPIQLTGETDRVYLNTRATCTLDDPALSRRITVAKTGSDATVLWNPWTAKAKAMSDFSDDEWPGMICIETANAGETSVTLAPGATHTMTATLAIATR